MTRPPTTPPLIYAMEDSTNMKRLAVITLATLSSICATALFAVGILAGFGITAPNGEVLGFTLFIAATAGLLSACFIESVLP